MSEWNEKKLDEELNELLHDLPAQDDLEKRISQSINRRIRRAVFHTLAGILGVFLVALLIINPLMNLMFFNPYQMNKGSEQKMLGVLRDYFETTGPYREVLGLKVEKKGFSKYQLEMQIVDTTQPVNFGVTNVWGKVAFGKYRNITDRDFLTAQQMGRFSWEHESQEEILEQIRELPKSAKIYLAVSDFSIKSLEQLKNAGVTLEWLQIYQPEVAFQGGLSMQLLGGFSEDDIREQMTEEELLDVYRANLNNMLEYEEVWSEFGLYDGEMSYPTNPIAVLKETCENAEKLQTIQTERYCVSGKRDEVLQFLEKNTLETVFVENVRLW